ncbi:HNH endonuclease [Klebsiella oxytoca]|uniref:HNH endonuclease signature motif containing protein n=1 Tax=Klebsiella oxytoca TaxID=571 RepID=UPI001CC918E1|nr:HNH endonuclease [Klebsiella oxytoca]MBZ7696351.1 HNH endonuclease [Klebsiella oxytoca]HBS5699385.1 HNH endonuclease [Klebsiella aerogenes]
MKRLSLPVRSYTEMLNKCSEGMRQINVRNNFIEHFPVFLQNEQRYTALSAAGQLFTYARKIPLTNTTEVVGTLTKAKLENLYENNLRDKNKPAREYYDEMLVSSGEKCPFCGDIGQTKNIDHFLPIAHYPEFSVMPINLVPSCRDCNMGEKGEVFATDEEHQAIHPYIDKDIFYREQWVFANFVPGAADAISYYVECPMIWRQKDKLRALHHFTFLNIANRYRLEAGKHLSEIITQRNSFAHVIRQFNPAATSQQIQSSFIEAYLQPVIDLNDFPNYWKRVMYQCLANADEFFVGI